MPHWIIYINLKFKQKALEVSNIYVYICIKWDIYSYIHMFIYNRSKFIDDLYWIIKSMWITYCKYTLKFPVLEVI